MKKQIILAVAIAIATGISGHLSAQVENEAVLKTKTKSNQSNDRLSSQTDESRIVKILSTANGAEIVFNQAIVSPRDAASGLPTGKRQHKPIKFTKEIDKSSPVLAKQSSSGLGAGKASMSDLSVSFSSKGRTQKLNVVNGAFTLPASITDDDCDLVVSWSWGANNSGSSSRCEVPLKLSMVDGACVAVKERGKN